MTPEEELPPPLRPRRRITIPVPNLTTTPEGKPIMPPSPSAPPRAPEGVYVHYADGTTSPPLDVRYDGQDEDGLHQWTALGIKPAHAVLKGVTCSELPASASLQVQLDPE